MNSKDTQLLSIAIAQAMNTFAESCKQSGIKLTKQVILDTSEKVSQNLWVNQQQIAAAGKLLQEWKTQDEILQHLDTITQSVWENNTMWTQRDKILDIIDKIIDMYIQNEIWDSWNHKKYIEDINHLWTKKAWWHAKKILRAAQWAHLDLEFEDAKTDLTLNLTIAWIQIDTEISDQDIKLFYEYSKYLKSKKENI